MTRLPVESREVVGLSGPEYPKYRVGPLCAAPLCSRPVDHVHHLTRRSFLGGDYAWIKLPDGTITGNLSGLDHRCHQEITENKTRIVWNTDSHLYEWVNEAGEIVAPLSPQPPIHGQKNQESSVISNTSSRGPASKERCTECGRVLPHEHDDDKKKEPKRRRKTFVIQVPDDMEEDGHLVLTTLIDGCRELFNHDENAATRYFTISMALALVLQNSDKIMSDG